LLASRLTTSTNGKNQNKTLYFTVPVHSGLMIKDKQNDWFTLCKERQLLKALRCY